MSNEPTWDEIANEIDRYDVGGGCKTPPRTETVWNVLGREVRVRVRRPYIAGKTWQFYVNANCRGGERACHPTNILDNFPEYLDVRCPGADQDALDLIECAISKITKVHVHVSNEKFMPRHKFKGALVWIPNLKRS